LTTRRTFIQPTISGRNVNISIEEKRRRIQHILNGGLRDDMTRLGQKLQSNVVKEVAVGLKRPKQSEGRLAKITGNPRNLIIGGTYVRVGDIDWLTSLGKGRRHAMAIERGLKEGFVGRPITGYWLSGNGKAQGFDKRRTQDKFVPSTRQVALARLFKDNATRKNSSYHGVIKTPIQPHGDYLLGWNKTNVRQELIAIFRKNFR
jgi:hypothetical protein